MDVGPTIRRVRESRGLSRAAAAQRAGIPVDTLKKVERGRTGASLSMFERIARTLGVGVEDLTADAGHGGMARGHKGRACAGGGVRDYSTTSGPAADGRLGVRPARS